MTDGKTLLELDRKNVWHPYASMTQPPPVRLAVSASGTRIVLADGSSLIDALSSWWCVAHGHNHPAIMDAVRRQSEKLSQVMFAGFTHEPAIRLAETLKRLSPGHLGNVFFADSGSVAVECAMKLAIQYQFAAGKPKRTRLAALAGGYHGDTTGAMSLSDPDGMHAMFRNILPRHVFLPKPAIPFGGSWDDAAFEPYEKLLDEHADELAAVIAEPVFQGANAMNFYHPEYLKKLRRACTERGILLILDEIATCFGRTGRLFAANYADVAPDILCVGKALTGGAITLSAVLSSDAVAQTVSDTPPGKFMHGPTFMANPLACAAANASLALFESGYWKTETPRIERTLQLELEPYRAHENVKDVRVLGAVGVIEVKNLPAPERVSEIVRETGVWLRPFGNWIYTMPPLVTPDAELRRIAAAMGRLLD